MNRRRTPPPGLPALPTGPLSLWLGLAQGLTARGRVWGPLTRSTFSGPRSFARHDRVGRPHAFPRGPLRGATERAAPVRLFMASVEVAA